MAKQNRLKRLMRETAGFSYEFIRHPKGMGSLVPSSPALARAMCRVAQQYGHPDSLVIEAGAGTGSITRELVAHYPIERLIISEINPRLVRRLRSRFKNYNIRRGRVEALEAWQEEYPKTIVSSLPFRSLPPEVGRGIETVFFRALDENPDSILVQFTYGQKSPLVLPPHLGIQGKRVTHAWLNFPPAHIWVYRRVRSDVE
ncbi:MAG: phospholipid methyltransferase [Cardiobacteriaceae bacterium]|nr:phospholipid methyltransferase [Cardiobacteriaceae bacterium]